MWIETKDLEERLAAAKAEGAAEEREAILKELQVMSCGCSHKVRARREKKTMSLYTRFHKVDSAGECDPDCKICKEMWSQAKAEEREACAKLVDDLFDAGKSVDVGEAIRARGGK